MTETEAREQRSIHLEVEQLEKHHRVAMRRQRAIHALQRFYVNSTAYRKRRIDGQVQERSEKRARLMAALLEIQAENAESGSKLLLPSEDSSPVSIHNTIANLDNELLGLVKQQKVLEATLQLDSERRSVLRSLQAAEEYRLANIITQEIRGPVNGRFAIDLRTSHPPRPRVKTEAASAATEDEGDGRETEGTEDATEGEETDREEENTLTLLEGQNVGRIRKRPRERDRKRRSPEEIFRSRERAWATRYSGLIPCEGCGSHCTRQEMRSCDECGRTLCNRGGKSDGQPVGAFCVMVHACNCGTTQCYDCLSDESGRRGGGMLSWKRCAVGDVCLAPESVATEDYEVPSWVCDKEQSQKDTCCRSCGLFPICKKCQSSHERECGYVTSDSDIEAYDE